MNSLRVGLVLPYVPGEAAQMACVLADFLEQLGCRVDLVSSAPLTRKVHPRWDVRVRAKPSDNDFLAWVKKHQQLIWFEIPPSSLFRACSVKTCRNICVPLWPHLTLDTASCLGAFDRVVSPSVVLANMLQRTGQLKNVCSCSWDGGGAFEQLRHGTLKPGALQVLVLLDRCLLRKEGLPLLMALSILLDAHEGLEFTLAGSGRWSQSLLAVFTDLQSRFGPRIRVLRDLSYEARRGAIRSHDWVFCAPPAPASSVGAMECLGLGVPVIAYDIPPYNEVVAHGYNGAQLYLPTKNVGRHLGAIRAELNAHSLLEGLSTVLSDEAFLQRVQSRVWHHCENIRQAFRQLWRRELLDPGEILQAS